MITAIYSIILICLSIYSYALVDPNLTLINNPLWVSFRNVMVQFGYYQRELSSFVYIGFIVLLFLFHNYFVKNSHKISLYKILLIISFILFLSYPFLSHDFFNYLFDAKIVTVYHQNPYFHKALDYPSDQWIRFMQWTHRTYPYGPTWLLLTLIPSFLSFGKLILNFVMFKFMFIIFYVFTVYHLQKVNKKWAIFFATNPLVIMEGLISLHNDLIAVCISLIALMYLFKNNNFLSRFLLLFSGGIKYITLPLVFLGRLESGQDKITSFWRPKGLQNHLVIIGLIGLLGYLVITAEIQPWYFLALLGFLPVFPNLIMKCNIFFAGLLFSYYPFVRLGDWNSADKLMMKHAIIGIFFIANLLLFLPLKNKTTSTI